MNYKDLDYFYGNEAEQFSFYRLPKALITNPRYKGISNSSKLLYGLMLDRMSLSSKNGWFDDDNRVYIKYSISAIMEDLNCSRATAVGLVKELNDIGLIDIVQNNGKANIIYVKNFISFETNEKKEKPRNKEKSTNKTSSKIKPVQKLDRSKNQTGTSSKTRPVPVQKLNPNNTNINNTNMNDTKSINQSSIYNHYSIGVEDSNLFDRIDGIDNLPEEEIYKQLIKQNINYNQIMLDETYQDKQLFDELYQIIFETVSNKKKTIRVAGQNLPYDVVANKFLKLNSKHLDYVINCMKNNKAKITNIKAYLITALFNAPSTMGNYYAAKNSEQIAGPDFSERNIRSLRTKFNNFENRQYDYDALEKMLIQSGRDD